MSLKIEFLGTGTSAGVPMIGCNCPVCISADSHNKRLRSSILLMAGNITILVDTTPDLRQQALRSNICELDAVLITHAHVDHLFGLDELRRINTLQSGRPLPLYAASPTRKDIERIFDYAFDTAPILGTYRPKFDLYDTPYEGTSIRKGEDEITLQPLPVTHGKTYTQGYKFIYLGKTFAYIPDAKTIPEKTLVAISNVDLLVLDTLRYREHPTHLTLQASLEIIEKAQPKRALLTHLCHDFDHATLANSLPQNIAPAYDGLKVEI